jgi:hypothetical protein
MGNAVKAAEALDKEHARLGYYLDRLPRDGEQSDSEKKQENRTSTKIFHLVLRLIR